MKNWYVSHRFRQGNSDKEPTPYLSRGGTGRAATSKRRVRRRNVIPSDVHPISSAAPCGWVVAARIPSCEIFGLKETVTRWRGALGAKSRRRPARPRIVA